MNKLIKIAAILSGKGATTPSDPSRQDLDFSVLPNGAIPDFLGSTFDVYSGIARNLVSGTELLSNPGFDSSTTGWTPTNATIASVAGGESGNCCELTRTGGTTQNMLQTAVTAAGDWVIVGASRKAGSSGNENSSLTVRNAPSGTVVVDMTLGCTAAWQKRTTNLILTTTSTFLRCQKNTATAGTMLFDSCTMFRIDTTKAMSVRKYSSQYGNVKASMMRETATARQEPYGVVMCVDYPNNLNWVGAICEQSTAGSNKITLMKCVNGVITKLIDNASITYQADSCVEIRRAVDGNVFKLYYNSVQIGTDQTIADASIIDNVYHGIFDASFQQNRTTRFMFCATPAPQRITIIGDSICKGGGSYNTWAQYFRDYWRSGDHIYLDHSYGGATIMPNAGNDMATQVAAAASDNANYIFIAMGINDANGTVNQTTLQGYLTTLKSTNPSAVIYYINVWPNWTDNTGTTEVDRSDNRAKVSAACAAVGGITVIDPYTVKWYEGTDTQDGIHPIATGVRKMLNKMLAAVP
jgi:lysophospholipase L1-like esterase